MDPSPILCLLGSAKSLTHATEGYNVPGSRHSITLLPWEECHERLRETLPPAILALVLRLCRTGLGQDAPGPIAKPLINPMPTAGKGTGRPRMAGFSADGRYEFGVDTQVSVHSPPSSGRIRGLDDSGRACVTLKTMSPRPYRITVSPMGPYGEGEAASPGLSVWYDGVKPDAGGNGFFMHNFTVLARPGSGRRSPPRSLCRTTSANNTRPQERR